MPKLNMFRKLGSSSIFIGVEEVKDEKHAETLIKAGLATLFEEKKEEPKKTKEEPKEKDIDDKIIEGIEEIEEVIEQVKEKKKPKKSKHKK